MIEKLKKILIGTTCTFVVVNRNDLAALIAAYEEQAKALYKYTGIH